MAKSNASKKPKLHLCAAAWTMTNYPSAEKQWSMDRKVKAAKEAGFVGFSAGPQPEVAEACAKHGVQLVGGVDVGTVKEADEKMRLFHEAGAVHINVQLCDHDTDISKAVTVARAVVEAGDKHKVKKQLRPNTFWPRIAEYRPDLLAMSELIHFRTFTGSHCQTPITNGRGKLDADFIAWRDNFLRHALEAWIKAQRGAKELWAVVELGPKGSGYALDCFPDVWKDAIVARGEIESEFKKALRRAKK